MIVFDAKKCTGCMACQMACIDQRDVLTALGQKPPRRVEFLEDTLTYQSIGCVHCGLCMKTCPMDCYTRDELGYIVFDNTDCIACGACMEACPLNAISMSPESGYPLKCDGCTARIQAGLLPACVHTCPTGALSLK